MKRLFQTVAAAATASLLFAGSALADNYKVDPDHTFALFGVSHLGIGTAYGRFDHSSGGFVVDGAALQSVNIEIDAATVDTANKKRDTHLAGPDFFNVKQYPKLTFKSTAVEKSGDNTFKVTGDLTIRGVTKSMTIDVTRTGAGPDPWGNQRMGFETTFTINRMDFGVAFMPDGLGKEVKIILATEGIKEK